MICAPVRGVGMPTSVPCRAGISQIDSPSHTITVSNQDAPSAGTARLLIRFRREGGAMKLQWISAALLSLALVAGCGDRGNQNAQNSDPNAAPGVAAPADQAAQPGREEASPTADVDNPDADSARAAAGNRGSSANSRTTTRLRTPAGTAVRPAPASRDFDTAGSRSENSA